MIRRRNEQARQPSRFPSTCRRQGGACRLRRCGRLEGRTARRRRGGPQHLCARAGREAARGRRARRARSRAATLGGGGSGRGAIAVLEAEDEDEAARFRAAARGAGALVNVIDRPKFCDFSFGSIVERSPLVIARLHRRGGAGVRAGRALADRGDVSRQPARLGGGGAGVAAALFGAFPKPPPRDLARFLRPRLRLASTARRARRISRRSRKGRGRAGSSWSGTGAGRPDDLTLRAVRALQAADHVIADGPVPEALRDLGRREASFEAFPAGASPALAARRRPSGSRPGRRWWCWSPATGARRRGKAPRSRRAWRHEPLRLRPRLLRGARHRARTARRGGGNRAQAGSRRSVARRGASRPMLFDDLRRCGGAEPGPESRSFRSRPTLRATRRCGRSGRRCAQARLARVVYLSTVGVYGDAGGAWVDEAGPVRAVTPRARARVAAEAAWAAFGP